MITSTFENMDTKKWEEVLIEWVNCLKLSKTVHAIEELGNGEFLANLQKIITKSPNPEHDTLTFIFDILSSHYPNCLIDNDKDIHIADLPSYTLKIIVSLLMHYTCIYDRRDILTSPLCHSLSQNNQLVIRNFLQNVSRSTNNDDLSNIISECIEAAKVKESPSLHWLSGGSLSSVESPLKNILSTPVSRAGGRFQEKDRQIARLESELEVEKYEKKELQKEVGLYIDKNKKLEKILEQKNSEISGLRLEITDLESRTPPHYQDTDSRTTQKRLRSEIENLEKYIHQLNEEQEQILEEKDAAKDKLKKLEFECAMWQEKFFASEKTLEAITEKSKLQENRIETLKTHCDELTSMLNELKHKSFTDSCVEDSFQISPFRSTENVTASCESLAHSVVEVQLRDVQKELTETCRKLIRSQERCALLETDIEILNSEKRKIINENQEVVIQLSNNKETLEQTIEELQACHKELAVTGMKIIAQSKDISSLEQTLSTAAEQLLEKENDNTNLKEELNVLKGDLNEKNKTIRNLELKITSLENTKTELMQNIKSIQQHLSNISNEMEITISSLKETQKSNSDLENNLLICTEELNECKNLIVLLKEKILVLEKAKQDKELESTALHEKNCIMQKTLEQYRLEIEELRNKILNLEDTVTLTKSSLQNEMDKNSKANEEISKLIQDIDNLQQEKSLLEKARESQLEELKMTTSNLNRNKETVSLLSREIEESKQQTETLQNNLEKTQKSKQELEAMIETKDKEIELLKQDKIKTEDIFNRQLETIKKKLEESEESLKEVKKINSNFEDELSSNKTELINLMNLKESLVAEINQLKNDMQKKEEQFKDDIQIKDDEILSLKENKKELQSSIEKKECTIREMEIQLCEKSTSLENAEKDLQNKQQTIQELEEQYKNSSKMVQDLQSNLSAIEDENSNLKLETANLGKALAAAKCDLQNALENGEKELKNKQQTVEEVEEQYRNCTIMVHDLQSKLSVMEDDNSNLKLETVSLEDALSTAKNELQNTIENTEKELENKHQTITELEERCKHSNIMVQDLQSKLSAVEDENSNLKLETANLEKALSSSKSELQNAEKDLKNTQQTIKELEEQCINSNSMVQDLHSKLSIIEDKNSNLKLEVANLEIALSSLKSELQNAEEDLKNKQQTIEKLEEQCINSNRTVQDLQSELSIMKDENSNLKLETINLEDALSSVKSELQNAIENSEKLLKNKQQTIEELQEQCTNSNRAVQDLQLKLSVMEDENSNLKLETDNLEKALSSAECDIQNELALNAKMEADIALLREEAVSDKEDKSQLWKMIDSLKQDVSLLQNTREDLLRELEVGKSSLDRTIANVLLLSKENEEIKLQNETLQKNVEDIQKAKEDLNSMLESVIKAKDEEISSMKKNKINLEETLKRQLEAINKTVEDTEESLEKVKKINTELEDELLSSKTELKNLMNLKESLLGEMNQLKDEMQKEAEKFKEKIQMKDNEILLLEENKNELQSTVEQKEVNLQDMEEQLSLKTTELETLNHTLISLQEAKANLEHNLEKIKQSTKSEISYLRNDNVTLNDKVMSLESKFNDNNEKIKELEEDKKKLTETNTLYLEETSNLKTKLDKLKEEFSNCELTNKDLLTSIESYKLSLFLSEEICSALRDEIDTLQNKLATAQESEKSLRELLEMCECEKAELYGRYQELLSSKEVEIEITTREKMDIQEELTRTKETLQSVTAALEESKVMNVVQEDGFAALRRQLEETTKAKLLIQEEINDMKEEINDLKQELGEKIEIIVGKDQNIQDLVVDKVELQNQVEQLQNELSQKMSEIEDNHVLLETKMKEIKDKMEQMNELQVENKEQITTNGLLLEKLSAAENLLEEKNKTICDCQRKLQEFEERNDELKRENQSYETVVANLQQEITNARSDLVAAENSKEYLSNEVKVFKCNIDKLEENNSIIKEKIVRLREKILLSYSSSTRESLQKQLEEETIIFDIVESIENDIEQLKQNKIYLEDIISQKDSCIERLENELNAFSRSLSALNGENEKLKNVIIKSQENDITIKRQVLKIKDKISVLFHIDSKPSLNQNLNDEEINICDLLKLLEDELEKLRTCKLSTDETINDKDAEIRKLECEVKNLLQKVTTLDQQRETLQTELSTTKEENLIDSQRLKSHYTVLLNEHRSTFANLKSVSEKVTTELNNCKIENQILQEELALKVKEMQKLEARLKEYEFKSDKRKNEQEFLKVENEEIKNLYEDLKVTFEENLETITILRKRNEKLEKDIKNLTQDLIKVTKNRDVILNSQTKIIEETENNVLRAHENAIEIKNDLIKELELSEARMQSERDKKKELQDELNNEIKRRQEVDDKLSNLSDKYGQLLVKIRQLYSLCISDEKEENEIEIIDKVIDKYNANQNEYAKVLNDFKEIKNRNNNLELQLHGLQKEIAIIKQEKEAETMSLESLQTDYDLVVSKYNQVVTNKENIEEGYNALKQKLESIENKVSTKDCTSFKKVSESFKKKLEIIFAQRNMLENLLANMRMTMFSVQQNINKITIPAFTFKQMLEKKESLDVILEDIYKHSSKITKQSTELVFKLTRLYDKCIDQLLTEDNFNSDNFNIDVNIDEVVEKITDLNDRTSDALEQLKALNKEIENILIKQENKTSKSKENVLTTTNKLNLNVEKFKEEDWKKKNMMLKQKLTLSENAKSNLEKKLRQLQEENKKLSSQQSHLENDVHYKMLLQDHIAVRDDHEKALYQCKEQYKRLLEEYEELRQEKVNATVTRTPAEELRRLKQAYGDVMSTNSKLEMEIVGLRQIIEERNIKLGELSHIKEAYEKLLEENSKLMAEVDTLKYKRTRDRDEFVRLLKKEREEAEQREARRIQQVRAEYENKLEKMKEKMLKLYKEEINKEMDRVKSGNDQNNVLIQTIENLRGDLFEAEQKISFLEAERDLLKSRQLRQIEPSFYLSRESLTSADFKLPDSVTRSTRDRDSIRSISSIFSQHAGQEPSALASAPESGQLVRKTSSSSIVPSDKTDSSTKVDDRKMSTLPRSAGMSVIEEITISRRRSVTGLPSSIGQDLQMEDEEDDCFNNKYLADLKEGRCNLPTGRGTNRFSELAWRNSLVPPHLKSSYPAELQFASPSQFKEDDIKAGNIEMDNSLCKLLPGEKPRKKDFGTTSYKKPGPPTPSKNGGRLSLQGNEIHPLREHNVETKTPKRMTPHRIRALFMGKVNSIRDNSENQPSPTRSRRVSFFRKPK